MEILVWDYGLSIEHCLRMVDGGKNHVVLFTDWPSGAPKFNDYAPGLGFDKEGVEKTLYFADYIPKADLIMFMYSGGGDLCNYLRNTIGTPIFGAGLGERIENHRQMMRKIQSETMGLPVQKTTVIKGVPKLREYLKRHEDVIVKIDIFRGDMETLTVKDYDEVKIPLDKLEFELGGFSEDFDFMVEEFVDGVETGFNAFFNGREFATPYMWTFLNEPGTVSFGKYVERLPDVLQKVADAFVPVLSKLNYRGCFCCEVRVTKKKEPYLIDVCGRFSYPESLVFLESITNFPEVIYKTAKGEPVKLETAGKYYILTCLDSPEAKDTWLQVKIDPKYRKYIKLYTAAQKDGKLYSIKGAGFPAVIAVHGDNLDKLVKATELISKKVSFYKMDKAVVESLPEDRKIVLQSEEYGMGKF